MWSNIVKTYALHSLDWCFAEDGWYKLDAPPVRDLSALGSITNGLRVSPDLMKLLALFSW